MIAAEIDDAVLERFPDYGAVVLVARGVTNGPTDAGSEAALRAAEEHLRARALERASEHPHIAQWRTTFGAFGAKPSRFPCSAEALMSRVIKGGELPRINVLVDLYNAVSVRHAIPLGGEDADRLEGTLRLTVAAGGEPFEERGDAVSADPVRPGEVVWRDDAGVTCRRWNWRQGARTQLTDATRSAFFVFDRLSALPDEELEAAVAELERMLAERFPGVSLERVLSP